MSRRSRIVGGSSGREVLDTMSSLSAEIEDYQRAISDLEAGEASWPPRDDDRHRHDLFPSPGDARSRRRR